MKIGVAKLAFAGMAAAALAFGGTQAFAAPAAAESSGARACTDDYCRNVVCAPFPGVCRNGKCLCAG